jgi:hypothetical protein
VRLVPLALFFSEARATSGAKQGLNAITNTLGTLLLSKILEYHFAGIFFIINVKKTRPAGGMTAPGFFTKREDLLSQV